MADSPICVRYMLAKMAFTAFVVVIVMVTILDKFLYYYTTKIPVRD